MQISGEARDLWGDRIHAVVPEAEFVSGDAEAGWLSVDVLRKPDTEFIDALLASDALRWVQSAGAGYDTWHFQELLRRGVRLSTAHVNNVPIAEFVMREVMDRFQRADEWRAAAAEHRWEHHEWREVYGVHLAGGRGRRHRQCRRRAGPRLRLHRDRRPPEPGRRRTRRRDDRVPTSWRPRCPASTSW